jgi:hypothetical protein
MHAGRHRVRVSADRCRVGARSTSATSIPSHRRAGGWSAAEGRYGALGMGPLRSDLTSRPRRGIATADIERNWAEPTNRRADLIRTHMRAYERLGSSGSVRPTKARDEEAARTARGPWLVPATGLIAAIVIAGVAANTSYSYDESVTVGAFVRHDALTPFTQQRLHNNHPVFSFVEHLVWRTGADSEWAFRLLPTLFLAAATALVGSWVVKRWGTWPGVVAVSVMVTHPLTVTLARQVRGYSLMLLAATVATLLVLRLVREPHDSSWATVGYVAAVAIGVGTHLYMCAVVLSHVGFVLSRRGLSWSWLLRWAAGGALGALAYVAISPTEIRRQFQPSFPVDAAWEVLGAAPLAVLVLGVCTAAVVIVHRRVWLMVLLPVIAVGSFWLVVQPRDIYPRFLVWAVPAIAVAAAWVVNRTRWALVPVLVAVAAMAVVSWPVDDPGIRRAAELVDAARAQGYQVCTIGAEALWAYTSPGIEFIGAGQDCDVLVSIGSWRPAGYDEVRAALTHHAQMGDVLVAATHDIPTSLDG